MLNTPQTKPLFQRLVAVLIILNLTLNPLFPLIPSVSASTTHTVNIGVEKDSFWVPSYVTTVTDRHAIAIGNTWWGSWFQETFGLIKFNNLGLPANAVITNMRFHFVERNNDQGGYQFNVRRVLNDWPENGNNGFIAVSPESYGTHTAGAAGVQMAWRHIDLDPSMFNYLRDPNFGIALMRSGGNTLTGGLICSSDNFDMDGAGVGCEAPHAPYLAVTYVTNVVPNTPNNIFPDNGWQLGPRTSGVTHPSTTCTQGAGCNVFFRINSSDPDSTFPLTNTAQLINNSYGGNANFTQQGSGNVDSTRHIADGNWSYRAWTTDAMGATSPMSPIKNFLVDTTPPSTPELSLLPAFSPGLQNTITSTISTDELVGGVEYEFEISQEPDFSLIFNTSGWISSNIFTFGSLQHGVQYFHRVRARDSLWNTTPWSNIVSSTQDALFPTVDSSSLTTQRISPMNEDGVADDTQLHFSWTEENISTARVQLINSLTSSIERTYNLTPTAPAGSEIVYIDGRDQDGNFLTDGAYIVKIELTDLAGNTFIDGTQVLIIDNTPASINISSPTEGSWFNTAAVNITGQTEIDASLAVFSFQFSVISNVVLDVLGIFSHSEALFDGENIFQLNVVDNTGNQSTQALTIYRETKLPEITVTDPASDPAQAQNGFVNTSDFNLTLNLNDFGPNISGVDYISGINSHSINLAVERIDNIGNPIELITEGINVNPSLGNFTHDCANPPVGALGLSGAPSCTLSYTFTSLQPDGEYRIFASVRDVAGNTSTNNSQTFQLDTHTYNQFTTPSNGSQFNHSQISLSGTAEKYSIITVTNNHGTDHYTFTIQDDGNEPPNVTVSNCRPSANPAQDGIVEICDWEINNFQLHADYTNNVFTENTLTVQLTDRAGNKSTQTKAVSVNLLNVIVNIATDLDYISPNGDGVQDTLQFINISTDGVVASWRLEILASPHPSPSELGEGEHTVKVFNGAGALPTNIFWDAQIEPCFVSDCTIADGVYTYTLHVTTTDNIEISSTPKTFTSVTSTENTVVITYPVNSSFTSRGVTNITGIAPAGQKLTICNDIIGMGSSCDYETTLTVNSDGTFSTIHPLLLLPDTTTTQHTIYAYATDNFGNNTPNSNQVNITYTVNPPFNSISILPAFTGVNNEADYQNILNKINNNEEITQADIDALRSVVFRSEVNLGTERVILRFADHTNLTSLPAEANFQELGYITNQNQTRLYQTYNDSLADPCTDTTCTWSFYYPVPYMSGGGIYEIEFDGKLGTTIQKQSAALTIDANIPTAPIILDIDKWDGHNYVNTNLVNSTFYSNNTQVLIKGLADPLTSIQVLDQDSNIICSTTTSPIGLWSCAAELSVMGYHLTVRATLGLNTVESLDPTNLIIDTIPPEFNSLQDSIGWRKSGDNAEISFTANEALLHAFTQDNPINGCTNAHLMTNTKNNFILNTSRTAGSLSFPINGNSVEGKFCLTANIQDLAGNQTTQILEIYIDNTPPLTPNIEKSSLIDLEHINWGERNGKFALSNLPALGRLTPEYTIRGNILQIKTEVEELTQLHLLVDNAVVQTIQMPDRADPSCIQTNIDKVEDGVITQSGYYCEHTFTYTFTQEKGYLFQLKSIDLAGNQTPLSQSVVVYYDKTPPQTPVTVTANLTDWQVARNQDITAANLGTGNNGRLPITNKNTLTFTDLAEPLSDIEYTFKLPNNTTTLFTQKSGTGADTRTFNLEQDGIYTVESVSWDAAGNQSNKHLFQFEKDTIPPKTPEVNLSLSGNTVFASISGEDGAFVTISGNVVGKLINGGLSTSLGFIACGSSQTYNIQLRDRAGNVSEGVSRSISGPVCPPSVFGIGGGGDGPTYFSHYESAKAWVTINKEGVASLDWFEHVPSPILSTPVVEYQTQIVSLSGIALPPGFKYDVEMYISEHIVFYSEAYVFEKCGLPSIFFTPDPDCIKKILGEYEYNRREKAYGDCKDRIPLIIFIRNIYNDCIKEKIYEQFQPIRQHKIKSSFNVKSSLVHLFKNGVRIEGRDVYPDLSGNFFQTFGPGEGVQELKESDRLSARVFIRGGITFGVEGKMHQISFGNLLQGWGSGLSNEVVVGVDEVTAFFRNAQHPLSDPSCAGFVYQRGFTGSWKFGFHDGIDWSKFDGCDIRAVGSGTIYKASVNERDGSGNFVYIQHPGNFFSVYLHGRDFPKVKEGDLVDASTIIMYMGNTGNSQGTHLHFSLWHGPPWHWSSTVVDPKLYFSFLK